jgi:hypothetical protein
MSYIILRGRWCNIIILNVPAPCEYKGDDVKDSFYEELGRVFDQFPMYDINILLGDFNSGKLLSNPQSGMRDQTKQVMIIELE